MAALELPGPAACPGTYPGSLERPIPTPSWPHTHQGWSSFEDSAKGHRGTGAGTVFSSLAAPTAAPTPGSSLLPLYATHPNETRLQELLDLQRRKLGQGPGPGQYEVRGGRKGGPGVGRGGS